MQLDGIYSHTRHGVLMRERTGVALGGVPDSEGGVAEEGITQIAERGCKERATDATVWDELRHYPSTTAPAGATGRDGMKMAHAREGWTLPVETYPKEMLGANGTWRGPQVGVP